MGEAAFELVVGGPQRDLRINLAVSRQVRHGEQDIAQFVCHPDLVHCAGFHFSPQFSDLLFNLVDDRAGALPVEADARCPLLELLGSHQGGEGPGHAVQGT